MLWVGSLVSSGPFGSIENSEGASVTQLQIGDAASKLFEKLTFHLSDLEESWNLDQGEPPGQDNGGLPMFKHLKMNFRGSNLSRDQILTIFSCKFIHWSLHKVAQSTKRPRRRCCAPVLSKKLLIIVTHTQFFSLFSASFVRALKQSPAARRRLRFTLGG